MTASGDNAASTPDLAATVDRARRGFTSRFRRAASVVVAAPGRVNLIGDHTDYNDGFAMPMAIDRHVVIAADLAAADADVVSVYSAAMDETRTIDRKPAADPTEGWSRYVAGVLTLATASGRPTPAFDAWIESTVPVGAGLASSAALEVAVATLVEVFTGRPFTPIEKATLCQRAEHEHAGVPCGLMDQIAVTMSKPGHALRLDCRSHETTPIALPTAEVTVLIADSGVRRELAAGIYAERRRACHDAAHHLGVATLRDASLAQLIRAAPSLSAETVRRARHVITENDRVLACAEAIASGRWSDAGRLMDESHDSLRDDFEVSIAELERLVDAFRAIGEPGGVFGSRLTGAGLGGCVVALVRADAADLVATQVASSIGRHADQEPSVFATAAVHGAQCVTG